MSTAEKGYIVSGTDPNVRTYAPNAIVIQEDTPDDGCIYILNKGTLGVFKGGEEISEITDPGVFGEMATVLHTTRTATIKAMTECKITVYTGGLQRILEQLPSIALKIMVSLAKRLERQNLIHTDDLVRLENIEKMNQQLRKQVVDSNKQVEELKTAAAAQATESRKPGSLFGRRR
jgi:CRP-like cAMP-binding protein